MRITKPQCETPSDPFENLITICKERKFIGYVYVTRGIYLSTTILQGTVLSKSRRTKVTPGTIILLIQGLNVYVPTDGFIKKYRKHGKRNSFITDKERNRLIFYSLQRLFPPTKYRNISLMYRYFHVKCADEIHSLVSPAMTFAASPALPRIQGWFILNSFGLH